jgi:hypothetical protein
MGEFRSCVRKRIPPDLRNDQGLQVTRQPENGTGVRLPGWLHKYGAGLKRLLARCRSSGNMLLSGCPWVAFKPIRARHAVLLSPQPRSHCRGYVFILRQRCGISPCPGPINRGRNLELLSKRNFIASGWEGELEPCPKC